MPNPELTRVMLQKRYAQQPNPILDQILLGGAHAAQMSGATDILRMMGGLRNSAGMAAQFMADLPGSYIAAADQYEREQPGYMEVNAPSMEAAVPASVMRRLGRLKRIYRDDLVGMFADIDDKFRKAVLNIKSGKVATGSSYLEHHSDISYKHFRKEWQNAPDPGSIGEGLVAGRIAPDGTFVYEEDFVEAIDDMMQLPVSQRGGDAWKRFGSR